MKSTLHRVLLDIAAVLAGVSLWFYQFAMGFADSNLGWTLVALQVVGAFVLGGFSGWWVEIESRGRRGFRLFLYELGHVYMWIWAAANYEASGKIEFSVGYFLLPGLVDVIGWWFGLKAGVKRRFVK